MTIGDVQWQVVLEEDGRIGFRVGRAGSCRIAEWPGRASLRADLSNGSSALTFSDGVDLRWRQKLERGLVRAMLAQLGGKLTLHAAAVANETNAVLLIGASGAGKSTLAAALGQSNDLSVAADDVSPIAFHDERAWIEPSEADIWLWQDSARALRLPVHEGTKAPIAMSRMSDRAVPISTLVVLKFDDADGVRVRSLRGHDALSPLLAATVRLVIDDREMQLRELADLERLVSTVRVLELTRPRDFRLLGASIRKIESILSGET